MEAPKWLADYFGPDLEKYSPVVVLDGVRYAVVRISSPGMPKEFKSMGYILVKKNGSHSASTHESLHEGLASSSDMEKMVNRFNKAEEK